jgi:uncharacterized protein (TIGR03437 family)
MGFSLHMKLFLIAAVMPAFIFAHSNGPEPRRTGAPGDNGVSAPFGPTCASCHTGTPGTGSVQISAAEGSTYTPGQKQRITVTINATPAARLYGFEATARLVSNLSNGQAGTLQPSNSETQVICEDERRAPCRDSAPVQFIEHNAAKAGNSYEFDWTPPADAGAGDVRFYVAANAANGDGRDGNGDRVFTANVTLTPAAGGGGGGPKPAISSNGVVNGATFTAGIVGGSWATIQGTDLAQTTRIWEGSDFNNGQAPTELDGVKVSVDGKAAAVYYISSTQINVQVPTLDRTGSVPVEVTTKNGTSNTASADARRAAPGWFMFDPESRKYIAGTQADGTFLGKAGLFGTAVTTRPAKPGDVITLYGANFGPTNPAMPAGRPVTALSPLVDTPSVTIGGANATVQYGGGAPNLIGTYQFNIVVPDVPNGDQPVVVQFSDGSKTQDNAFITIQR